MAVGRHLAALRDQGNHRVPSLVVVEALGPDVQPSLDEEELCGPFQGAVDVVACVADPSEAYGAGVQQDHALGHLEDPTVDHSYATDVVGVAHRVDLVVARRAVMAALAWAYAVLEGVPVAEEHGGPV